MKRLLNPLILFVFVVAMHREGIAFCANPQKLPGHQPDKNQPREQEPNLDGVVEVSFRLDNQGKVQILNINSTSPQLSDYVIKKLNKIQLDNTNPELGKIIKYRFVFKKQT
jgi:hypothetical protein